MEWVPTEERRKESREKRKKGRERRIRTYVEPLSIPLVFLCRPLRLYDDVCLCACSPMQDMPAARLVSFVRMCDGVMAAWYEMMPYVVYDGRGHGTSTCPNNARDTI